MAQIISEQNAPSAFSAWQEAQKVRRINSANGANKKKAVRVAENVAQTGKQKKRVECLGGLACGCGKLSVGAFGLACVKKNKFKI